MLTQDVILIISICSDVDDFYKKFEPEWRKILIQNQEKELIGNRKRRNRKRELSLSEAITIVTMFHKTGYITFKDYYYRFVTGILFGKLFGDKGYISQELYVNLYEKGLQIVTKLKKNMKNKLMSIIEAQKSF